MRTIAGFPRPDGLDPPGNHEVDEEVWIPSLEYLYEQAENKFPGLMARLLDDLEQNVDKKNLDIDSNISAHKPNDENENDIDNDSTSKAKAAPKARRSLLKSFNSRGELRDYLKWRPETKYTQRLSSVFLHDFEDDERRTKSQFIAIGADYMNGSYLDGDWNIEFFDFNDVRLGSTNSDKAIETVPASDMNSAESLLNKNHALHLILLCNKLVGSYFFENYEVQLDAINLSADKANVQSNLLRLFDSAVELFDCLFYFLEELDIGLTVTAKQIVILPTGGHADIAVRVSGENVNLSLGERKNVSEFPAIIEFSRPNAGLWIGWTLLTGQKWTEAELDAFHELTTLPLTHHWQSKLENWQKSDMWPALKNLVNLVGSKQVDVKYSESIEEPAKLRPSYFIRDGDQVKDITSELTSAKLKICVDNTLDALAQVTHYATRSNCDRIAIADGLTFIPGSLNKLVREPKGDSNPEDSDHVLSAIFDSTAMIQTHERDSSLGVLNFLCDSAMTSRVRCAAYLILSLAEDLYKDNLEITPEKQAALREKLTNHGGMIFDSDYHCKWIPGIEEGARAVSRTQRTAILKALADKNLTGVAEHVTSKDFVIREWYRETAYMGYAHYESNVPVRGRSKSVARVQLSSCTNNKNYVLKEYFGDGYSIDRWKRELDAYIRVGDLRPDDRKHFVDLVAIGTLDLDDAVPRLFLLLEYVEKQENAPTEGDILDRELTKVAFLLESVSVYHNDYEDRNYRWQCDTDGSWYIKLFDFDRATFRNPREHYPTAKFFLESTARGNFSISYR